jgi:hypothetical protein
VRPATGAVPAQPPIWARSETGPVLLPGEHAPWRAQPVAPPQAEEEDGDGRSLFFAPPVAAPRNTQTGPLPVVRRDADPADLENTGDADLRGVSRHRDPLPDHLDFITGLGLRGKRTDDEDEVGPSS